VSSQRHVRIAAVRWALGIALAGTLAAVCLAQSLPIERLTHFPRTTLDIVSHGHRDRFKVWIANTQPRQEQGLMFVRDLPPGQGMIFPESSPQVAHFWMKNTFIPLDMVFVGEDHRIAKIIANAHPFSLDVLSSDVPVIAVLEIAGGEAKRLGLGVGDRVSWNGRAAGQ